MQRFQSILAAMLTNKLVFNQQAHCCLEEHKMSRNVFHTAAIWKSMMTSMEAICVQKQKRNIAVNIQKQMLLVTSHFFERTKK